MKVALFTDSRAFAGTERHLLDLAQALRASGTDTTLVAPSRGLFTDRIRAEGLPLHPLETHGWHTPFAVWKLRAALRSGRWDLLHTHNGRTGLLAALARRLAGRGTLVATQHFIDPARTLRRGWRATLAHHAHRWVERQTTAIIAVSEAVRTALLHRDDTPPAKVHVVLNGVRDPANPPPHHSPAAVRATLGLPPNAPLIVCVCRLSPEKSVETLLRALPSVLAHFPDALCLVVGTGTTHDYLAGEILRLDLARSVRLLGFQSDPYSLMAAGTVFVLPSRAEPFGLALVEAMALGQPCVATNVGGPPEIIEPQVSGLLVPPDDPPALAVALTTLLADPGVRARLGTAARARYEARFTADTMARHVRSIYEAALRASPDKD